MRGDIGWAGGAKVKIMWGASSIQVYQEMVAFHDFIPWDSNPGWRAGEKCTACLI